MSFLNYQLKVVQTVSFIPVACRKDNVDRACQTLFHIHSSLQTWRGKPLFHLCALNLVFQPLIRLGLTSPYSIHKLADIYQLYSSLDKKKKNSEMFFYQLINTTATWGFIEDLKVSVIKVKGFDLLDSSVVSFK